MWEASSTEEEIPPGGEAPSRSWVWQPPTPSSSQSKFCFIMCWDLLIPWLESWEPQRLVFHCKNKQSLWRGCAFSPSGQRPSTEQDPEPGSCSGGRSWSSPSSLSASQTPFKDEAQGGKGGGDGWGTQVKGAARPCWGWPPKSRLFHLHVERVAHCRPRDELACKSKRRPPLEFCLTGEL